MLLFHLNGAYFFFLNVFENDNEVPSKKEERNLAEKQVIFTPHVMHCCHLAC